MVSAGARTAPKGLRMSYYAAMLLAYRRNPRIARKLARDIIAGAPAPYMTQR